MFFHHMYNIYVGIYGEREVKDVSLNLFNSNIFYLKNKNKF